MKFFDNIVKKVQSNKFSTFDNICRLYMYTYIVI